MRGLWAPVLAVGVTLAFASAASAAPQGQVVFSSERCADEADNERRPNGAPGFQSNCRGAIWAVGDDGSNLRRLTDGGVDAYERDSEPSWSPDGSRIAFEGLRITSAPASGPPSPFNGATYGSAIWIMRSDGGGAMPVTTLPRVSARHFVSDLTPSWSPDGRRVVFASNRPTADAALGLDFNLYTVNADGSGLTQITFSPEHEFEPGFAPDGKSVIFTRVIAGERLPPGQHPTAAQLSGQGVHKRDLLSGEERQLTASDLGPGWGAIFSPDGRRIAFSLQVADLGYVPLTYTMNSDGSDLRRRTSTSAAQPTFAGNSTLIFSRPGLDEATWLSVVLGKLELDDPDAAPVTLTSPWRHPRDPDSFSRDAGPSWHSLGGVPEALRPSVDRVPPVVQLIDSKSGRRVGAGNPPGGASSSANLEIPARRLGYFAADRSGIRSVEVAVARRRGRRCRHLGVRLGPLKRCDRPVFRRLKGVRGWRALTRRLAPGTHLVRFRTRDRRGNTSLLPRARYVRTR